MNYGELWDLYQQKRLQSQDSLTFSLFGVTYEVVTIGLFDHRKDLAEILLKSKDLDMTVTLDLPISFKDLHNWLIGETNDR